MTFLSKLGSILVQGSKIIVGISPFLQGTSKGVVDKASQVLEQVIQIVVDMEVLGQKWGLTGAQKLEGATTQAVTIFLNSAFLVGRKINNATLFREGVSDVVNGVVKILNSAKADGLDTEDVVQ